MSLNDSSKQLFWTYAAVWHWIQLERQPKNQFKKPHKILKIKNELTEHTHTHTHTHMHTHTFTHTHHTTLISSDPKYPLGILYYNLCRTHYLRVWVGKTERGGERDRKRERERKRDRERERDWCTLEKWPTVCKYKLFGTLTVRKNDNSATIHTKWLPIWISNIWLISAMLHVYENSHDQIISCSFV